MSDLIWLLVSRFPEEVQAEIHAISQRWHKQNIPEWRINLKSVLFLLSLSVGMLQCKIDNISIGKNKSRKKHTKNSDRVPSKLICVFPEDSKGTLYMLHNRWCKCGYPPWLIKLNTYWWALGMLWGYLQSQLYNLLLLFIKMLFLFIKMLF